MIVIAFVYSFVGADAASAVAVVLFVRRHCGIMKSHYCHKPSNAYAVKTKTEKNFSQNDNEQTAAAKKTVENRLCFHFIILDRRAPAYRLK